MASLHDFRALVSHTDWVDVDQVVGAEHAETLIARSNLGMLLTPGTARQPREDVVLGGPGCKKLL